MNYPDIDVVIIGINVEKYLKLCIDSVYKSDYPKEKIHVIYADGGSRDKSIEIAKNYPNLQIVEVNDPYPTPGKGRNAGYRIGKSKLVQFMDADTIIDPNWFKNSIPFLKDKVVAVCGRRKELYPDKNYYHKITDIEWNYEYGPCRYFGGEVLIYREKLEEVNGFDPDLIAGEDPELSYRIRQKGNIILRANLDMTLHDINMKRFAQYYKRGYRTGYAYAEIGLRFKDNKEKLWLKELIRTFATGFIFITGNVLSILVCILNLNVFVFIPSLFFTLFPFRVLLKFNSNSKKFKITRSFSILYSLHLVLNTQIQFIGVIRYFWGRVFKSPLTNLRLK